MRIAQDGTRAPPALLRCSQDSPPHSEEEEEAAQDCATIEPVKTTSEVSAAALPPCGTTSADQSCLWSMLQNGLLGREGG